MDVCGYRFGLLCVVFKDVKYVRKTTDGIELEEDDVVYTYKLKKGIYKEEHDLAPWFDDYTVEKNSEHTSDEMETPRNSNSTSNNPFDDDDDEPIYHHTSRYGCGYNPYPSNCGYPSCGGWTYRSRGGCGGGC